MPASIWEHHTSPGVSRSGCLSVELTSGSGTWFASWACLTGYLDYSCDSAGNLNEWKKISNPWKLYKLILCEWLLRIFNTIVYESIFDTVIIYTISHCDEWPGHGDDDAFIYKL